MRAVWVIAVVVAWWAIPERAGAQQQRNGATVESFGETSGTAALEAGRVTTEPPTLDGRLDEPQWAAARSAARFVQFRPNAGARASQPTGVHVMFSEQAMYVGMDLRDSAPDSIAGQLTRRDLYSQASDWAHVYVDSYDDRRTAYRFSVNPRGVQVDALHFGDTQEDQSWDAVWAAAVQIGEGGWTAEFRIPLSQLRFATRKGHRDVEWGVNFGRDIARYGERSYWAAVSPETAGFVSQFGRLTGVGDLTASRGLEISPYSVMRVTRAPALADHPLRAPTEASTTVGADVRYRVASDFNLSLSVNPDFGQVEADPSVVNLSAFETFLEERRPFFVEGTDLFRLTFPEWPPLFYSRRIGRAPVGSVPGDAGAVDMPSATTILAAAKLSGRTQSGWSVGVLDAVTANEQATVWTDGTTAPVTVEPAANYAVARIMKDLRQGESAIGLMVTAANRAGAATTNGAHTTAAYVVAADGRHRFAGGRYQLRGSLASSHVHGSADALSTVQRQPGRYFQRPDARHLAFDSTRTTLSGAQAGFELAKTGGGPWRWAVSGTAVSPGYEINDLGFNQGADRLSTFGRLGYERFRPTGPFRRWDAMVAAGAGWSFGGERRYAWAQLFGNAELANRWSVWLGVDRDASALAVDALRGGPALWRPGYVEGWWGVETDPRRAIRFSLNGGGRRDDAAHGHSVRMGWGMTIRPSPRLELSLSPGLTRTVNADQYVETVHASGDPLYVFGRLRQTTASLTARLNYTFRPGMSLQLYAQPFYSAGAYDEFRYTRTAGSSQLEERLPLFPSVQHDPDANRYTVAHPAGGQSVSFGVPDFNFGQFRSNAVFRWEYRPGSTFYLVWGQERTHGQATGRFQPWDHMASLFANPGTNVLLAKISYWLSR